MLLTHSTQKCQNIETQFVGWSSSQSPSRMMQCEKLELNKIMNIWKLQLVCPLQHVRSCAIEHLGPDPVNTTSYINHKVAPVCVCRMEVSLSTHVMAAEASWPALCGLNQSPTELNVQMSLSWTKELVSYWILEQTHSDHRGGRVTHTVQRDTHVYY